jgi:mono/diheme cytochrome c family protein
MRIAPIWLLGLGLAVSGLTSGANGEAKLSYNKDIRPILADACFACHGPDSASRKADLRLDQREAAIEMGAITPDEPDASELMARIVTDDADLRMPPPATKKTLTPEQIEKLEQWISQGAEYELHWSFIPPQRPALPEFDANSKDEAWVRNPIDRFVLAQLKTSGLTPAPEADRRTLARRAALDITGLPPDPQAVEAFVASTDPAAYEQYIDKLLDSVAWGEHRGRYWLDYARYADTHGIHFDNYREMWSYRDWVIQAFNRNMPFDQFTIENLAGDLLPNRTLDQQIGSGFNRCNMTTNEGGIIDEEYAVLYARDRTETTALVWLGLTAGCAVCHSHKFDPLSQEEFYKMSAFFNNTTQPVRDGNIKDTPPIVSVPRAEDRQRWKELPGLLAEVSQALDVRRSEARGEFDQWVGAATEDSLGGPVAPDQLAVRIALDEGAGETTQAEVAGEQRSVALRQEAVRWEPGVSGSAIHTQGAACELPEVANFDGHQPFSCAAWVNLPANDGTGSLCARMDSGNSFRGWDFWVQRRQIGVHLVNAWPNTALKVIAQQQVPANQWVHIAVTYDGSGKAAGVRVYYNGVRQATNVENDRLQGTIRTDVAFRVGERSNSDPFTGTLQDLRLYSAALTDGDVASLANRTRFGKLLAQPANQRKAEELDQLYAFWLSTQDAAYRDLVQQKDDLSRELDAINARGTIAHVMQERDAPAMAYVLFRGEYDQRRDEVQPDTPSVLPPFPAGAPRNRLGFAQWLLLPDHPLTARVTVNRFWQEVFGTGIVATTGDFGVSGQLPSHPELLDWLAVEFRESGWDVKQLFRLMLTSSAYRQAALATPEKLAADPDNRLLSRGPRFRMDAEMVRDVALKASGLLVPKVGGPSVKPYQPEGVWEAIAMNVSNTRSYEQGTNEDLYRRSLYTFVKRMAPPASLEIFNAPNRELCVVRRERTNTPLQALVTLNDEQFVEAARQLATRVLRIPDATDEDRFQAMGKVLVARPFGDTELRVITTSLGELTAYYDSHPDDARRLVEVGDSPIDPSLDAKQLAAWTMLANQLMNLDEVLNK